MIALHKGNLKTEVITSVIDRLEYSLRKVKYNMRELALRASIEVVEKGNIYDLLVQSDIDELEAVLHDLMMTYAQTYLINYTHLTEAIKAELIKPDTSDEPDERDVHFFLHRNLKKAFIDSQVQTTYAVINGIKNIKSFQAVTPELHDIMMEMSIEKREGVLQRLKDIGHDCMNCTFLDNKEECEIYRAIPDVI